MASINQPGIIRTRLLIFSDTHGRTINQGEITRHPADVVLHCSDLTDGSNFSEFKSAIEGIEPEVWNGKNAEVSTEDRA